MAQDSDSQTMAVSEYKAGQDNVHPLGLDLHNPVFFISALVIVAFVLFALTFQEGAKEFFGWLRPWLTSQFDWVLMIAGNIFVLFCLFLIISPWGGIRIGGAEATPDYSVPAWFSMLFAAGMGIGLMFFGVLEPVNHLLLPPLGVDPANVEAARQVAMAGTIFHWGLHPWAIYGVVGLSLAFAHFNLGLPLTIRSAFYPLFGDVVWGWPGHVIDTLAVFATMFGLATSLGLGGEQLAAGLTYLFGIAATNSLKVILILGITAIAIGSVVLGMDAGVRRLSQLNMVLAMLLLAFVILAGATLEIVGRVATNTVAYVTNLPALSNWIGREDTGFVHDWTTFYWAWWIAWSPFVGSFIARISRGRTIRQFILAALIVPTMVSIIWMTSFGGQAISQYLDTGYTGVVQTVTDWAPELALYKMLEPLPLAGISSFVGMVLVLFFFVTSSDSGSIVIDTITAGGKVDAPVVQRVFWATSEGLVAIALLLGGGLTALQAATLSTGLPFALVLLAMCASLVIGLRSVKR